MKRELTRKNFLKVSGGALTGAYVLALAGCGGGGGGSSTDLRVAWWGSTERHQRTKKALEIFQKQHQNVNISTQFSGWDGYWEKIATQTAGGNAPDVFQMDYRFLSEYALRGTLLALDDLMPGTLDLSSFEQDEINGGRLNGKLYAVNLGNNSMALIYNAAALDEAGIEMPDHTMTWDEFGRLTDEISRATPEGFFGTQDASGSEPALECWLRQKGKALYTEEGKLAFGQDDLAEWFAYWEDLRKLGAAAPASLQATAIGDVQNSLVARGKAVVDFQNSNQLAAYDSVIEDKVGIHMFPQGGKGSEPGQYIKPSQLMSVYSRTEYPEAAARLIDALVTNVEVARALGAERGVPPSSKVLKAVKPESSPADRTTFEYLAFIEDKVGPLPPPPPQAAGEISEEILLGISQEIAFGRMSIDEGVDQFFSQAQRALQS